MQDRAGSDGTIKSHRTLFSILELMKTEGATRITEIADELDVSKGTVHKHLASLEKEGYVVKEDHEYRLGLQFFHDGVRARNQRDVFVHAHEPLDKLASGTETAATLIVEERGRGMFLANESAVPSSATVLGVGQWQPLHSTAGGKAILAHLPQERVDEIVADHGLPAFTDRTISDRGELAEELAEVREAGYALSIQEADERINAVAVPVVVDDHPVASVSIAGNRSWLTEERCVDEYLGPLQATAHDIEYRMNREG